MSGRLAQYRQEIKEMLARDPDELVRQDPVMRAVVNSKGYRSARAVKNRGDRPQMVRVNAKR